MADVYSVIILGVLIGNYVLSFVVDRLNVRSASPDVPDEFRGFYDAGKYRASQNYLKDTTNFRLAGEAVSTAAVVVFLLAGGFNAVDRFARNFGFGPVPTGLVFAGSLLLLSEFLRIPLSAYRTFVIEERYGFNRTTPRTFLLDTLKGWVLGALIGGAMFALVVWFFMMSGGAAWLYSWGAVALIEFVIAFVAPVVIMPLFNEFTPLEEGELRRGIEDYARKERFRMKGIFTMDGSRRSTKSNAFFTGFGGCRRIVLFDTLVARHTAEEVVAVLAHEMGHYKKRHILKFILLSAATTGIMFFVLSLFIDNRGLFDAFRMEHTSVYASLVFFGFLYAPLGMLLAVASNSLSRNCEYEADAYAAATCGRPGAMIAALKKLSVDNLANLAPHPWKVFLQYRHPPVLDRIGALRRSGGSHA